MSGIVHLVGAGPGDPELLTVKARRLLDTTDVVVHDRLIAPALLETIPLRTRRFAVGKIPGGLSTPQEEIADLLIRLARSGADVVRLKGGDPFVFGRGGEEAIALRAAGIPFDVVPGISAGIAGPGAAGIPVTHRGVARSVVFVTGETDASAGGGAVDWAAIAGIDTIVVFMGARKAGAVAGRLIAAGRDQSTPAAIVRDATLPDQAVSRLDLETLRRRGAGPTAGRPTLLVVGEVVRLGADLGGFWIDPARDRVSGSMDRRVAAGVERIAATVR